MRKLAVVLALIGFVFGANHAFAGQEDCATGEKWNEDTQKCEPQGD